MRLSGIPISLALAVVSLAHLALKLCGSESVPLLHFTGKCRDDRDLSCYQRERMR
jgi:hypothetical protein